MIIKTIVVGASATGKTTFVTPLDTSRKPLTMYIPTIGVDLVSYNKSGVRLQIWDSSGATRFASITRTFFRNINLCIAMYRNHRDLQNAKKHLDSCSWLCENDYRTILIHNGTNVDNEVEGQIFAAQKKIPFYSINALDRSQCIQCWHDIMLYCENQVVHNKFKVEASRPVRNPLTDSVVVRNTSYRNCFGWW